MDSKEADRLYRTYGPSVLRRARAILRDEDLARDVLQEVFVIAISQSRSFRGEASPMTWMYRITTNLCLNRIRDSSRRARLLQGEADEIPRHASPNDEQHLVASILRKVPEELRAVAYHHYVDQMSHEEIAKIMRTSKRTVGNRLEVFRRIARELAEPVERASRCGP